MEKKVTKVFLKKWFVSDEGVRDTCGFSLHLMRTDVTAFVGEYNASLPKEPPVSYEYADGNPIEVWVTDEVLNKIRRTKNGLRVYMEPVIEQHLVL